MSTVPAHRPEQRSVDPAARLRGLPGPARGHQGGDARGARGRLSAHRHRGDVRNEKGVGEAVRESGLDRSEVFVTSKLNNGFHAHEDALAAFDRSLETARVRLPRPVPDPLAAAGHRRRLRRDVEGDGGDLPQRRRQGDRRLQLPGQPPASAGPGDRDRAGGQPDRGAPLPDERRRTRGRHRARHRDRGLVTDRAGPRPGRSGHHRHRQGPRPDPGAGRASLAHAARRHRLPQVRDAQPRRGELRAVRLRALRLRHGPHHGAQQG